MDNPAHKTSETSRHLQIRILLSTIAVGLLPVMLLGLGAGSAGTWTLVLVGGVTVACAVAVGAALLRHLTTRMRSVHDVVDGLATGLPVQPVPARHRDELDHLAAAITHLHETLASKHDNAVDLPTESSADPRTMPPATSEVPLRKDLVAHVDQAPSSLDVLRRVDEMLGRIKSTTQAIDDMAGEADLDLLAEAVDVVRAHARPGHEGGVSTRLAEVCDGLGRTHDTILGELGRLSEQVAVARKSMRQQIRFDGTGVLEPLHLADLVDDAVRINRCELERSQVRVRRDYEDLPPVILDKLKVMHILINLVKQAADDLSHAAAADPHMELTLSFDDDAHIRVRIADNGDGFNDVANVLQAESTQSTIRSEYPFGFEQCCKLASEMGGRVKAESPGVGHGAIYVLEFPCRPLKKQGD